MNMQMMHEHAQLQGFDTTLMCLTAPIILRKHH